MRSYVAVVAHFAASCLCKASSPGSLFCGIGHASAGTVAGNESGGGGDVAHLGLHPTLAPRSPAVVPK